MHRSVSSSQTWCFHAAHAAPPLLPLLLPSNFALSGETGQELLLLDGNGKADSHLMVRITGGVFLDALKLFNERALYANAINDRTVPYHSASVHLSDVYELHTPYQVCVCGECLFFSSRGLLCYNPLRGLFFPRVFFLFSATALVCELY